MSQPIFQLARSKRRMRYWILVALLPLLLFSQIATAAYRCPLFFQAVSQSAAIPANCDDAEPDQPTLCKAHCEANSQAKESTADACFAPLAFDSHWVWQVLARKVMAPRPTTPEGPSRGGPPLYLLHMVLRN